MSDAQAGDCMKPVRAWAVVEIATQTMIAEFANESDANEYVGNLPDNEYRIAKTETREVNDE